MRLNLCCWKRYPKTLFLNQSIKIKAWNEKICFVFIVHVCLRLRSSLR
ncbi:hypothetical protein HPHPA9_0366 [Helicobacter pylori Hp A-9]|uniref:Uncharacterized protein n=1 Tax=Helicobacter pylori Hp A-9 TaxID=992034 RepID=J0K3U4_HELPX|nr:hypothetical protein HPHPA9_0366 [Helicobacter pylori Hp A-9]